MVYSLRLFGHDQCGQGRQVRYDHVHGHGHGRSGVTFDLYGTHPAERWKVEPPWKIPAGATVELVAESTDLPIAYVAATYAAGGEPRMWILATGDVTAKPEAQITAHGVGGGIKLTAVLTAASNPFAATVTIT